MCGRFSLGASATTLVTQFDLADFPAWSPRYNIAPTQEVLAVLKTRESCSRRPRLLRWGLVPPWADDPHIGNRLINARAETVATKPAFRRAFREYRCLILADGFYEWQRQGRHKQPFHIRMSDGRPFAFAGLWEHWDAPDGSPVESCTIITTTPNDLIGQIHNRMPVILAPEDYDLWLDPSMQEVERLPSVLPPYPSEEMTAYPVSTRVNNPANDSPECLEPVA
jgi:putative SOS response-associated peptidase YedK